MPKTAAELRMYHEARTMLHKLSDRAVEHQSTLYPETSIWGEATRDELADRDDTPSPDRRERYDTLQEKYSD